MLCADNSMQHAGSAGLSGASVLAVIPFTSATGSATTPRTDNIWHAFTYALREKWSADPSESPTCPSADATVQFNVTTRYYHAAVAAVRLDTHPSYHLSDTLDAAEAICLLIDTPLDDTSSTSPLQGFLCDLPDVECKLIVSMGTDGEHESDWELGHLAMEHGFELIHWKATEGQDRWDRVGVERMVEALEATMWQSMRVLGRGRSNHSANEDDTDDEGSEYLEGDQEMDPNGDPQESPDPLTRDANVQLRGASEGEACSSDDEDPDFGDYVAAPVTGDDELLATPFAAFLGNGDVKGHGYAEDEDLDGLFAEFARMRDIGAKGNDKQRRAMAEHATMSLWRAFGLSDDED